MTPASVRAFQQGPPGGPKPTDYLGVPLLADGVLGDKTRWALEMATLPQWRQDVVHFLLRVNGQREEGVNQGSLVDRAMAVCRLDNDIDGPGPSEDGHPWCAALACLALYHHCPYVFTPDASVRRLVKSLRAIPGELALPSDLAYFMHPDGVRGHLGTVIARGDGWTASIDGNLDDQVQVVRYPTAARLYVTLEPQVLCPAVPMALPIYGRGSTR